MANLICIVCPMGCHLQVDEKNNYCVSGNVCPRGEAYGKNELQNPTRVITSTVKVNGGLHRRCPVKTNGSIPKGMIFDAMKLLDQVVLEVPVKTGQIVLENVLDTGINIIAARSM